MRTRTLAAVTAVASVLGLASACAGSTAGETDAAVATAPRVAAAVEAIPPGTTVAGTDPAPEATSSTAAPASPPYEVTTTTLALVDTSRPTVSRGRRISTSRSLPTELWYPVGGAGPYPLVVFAHGYEVGVAPYRRAIEALAREGFVVAAPSFPLTDAAVAGAALDRGDLVNQPADVRFVVDRVLADARRSGSPLVGLIDPTRLAVVGHSDGADTALAVGYRPGDADPRIGAVIAAAPDPMTLPSGSRAVTSRVPLLLVHGDHDSVVPYASSTTVSGQVRAPGWFLTLRGADHLPPVAGPSAWTGLLDGAMATFLHDALTGADPRFGADLDLGSTPLATLRPLGG